MKKTDGNLEAYDRAYKALSEKHPAEQGIVSGFIECPECGKGKFGGLFYKSCSNSECKLFNSFAMSRCRLCGDLRVYCSC